VADPAVHRDELRRIRGLRIVAQTVHAKLKYGGNADAEHRAAVADRLAERRAPGDLAARAHLLRRSGTMGA
jgi:transcriptional regulator